ncbi:MAG: type 2 lanthipeptide synthetase LanM family protein [Verrucomicrobiota bacterium]
MSLHRIVGQAASLADRLGGNFVFSPPARDLESRQARLDTWCENVTRGDWKKFEHRLAWEKLDRDSALRLLGPAQLPAAAPLPRWAGILGLVLEESACATDPVPARCFDPQVPVPFEEFYVPFLAVAQRQLQARAGAACALLEGAAPVALERMLLQRLDSLAQQTLYEEFSLARHERQDGFAFLLAGCVQEESRELYLDFLARLRGPGLFALFGEYAVLGRLLATATLFWIESVAELLGRLSADLPELSRVFGNGIPTGSVVGIDAGLSDPHREGRTVFILTFASGLKLAYKPRDLGLDAAFSDLVAWLNSVSAPLRLKPLRILQRGSHGWVEFISTEPYADLEAGRVFYRRAGALLCLAYLLEGTDLHFANVIAHGEYPMLIDLETLLHPYWITEALGLVANAQVVAAQAMYNSVLRTGFLPRWMRGRDDTEIYDFGGLGLHAGKAERHNPRPWRHLNTDNMAPLEARARAILSTPAASASEQALPIDEHEEELTQGFEATYRFLMLHAGDLVGPSGKLQAFAAKKSRFVPRHTRTYLRMLRVSLQPKYLRHGIDFSINLERLSRGMIPRANAPALAQLPSTWPLWVAERESLERGDVPYFLSETDGANIVLSPSVSAPLNEGIPAFEKVLTRTRQLGESDLAAQVSFIRSAFYSRSKDAQLLPGGEPDADAPLADYDAGRLLAAAEQIARQISSRAVAGADGSMAWIAPQLLAASDRYQIIPLDFRLYDGSSGIALFLAALHRATGKEEFRASALATLKALRLALKSPEDIHHLEQQFGLGGCVGLGGILYTLTKAAGFLALPELLEEARQVLPFVTPETVARDSALDVFSGAAGMILGLLALHDAAPDPALVAKARLCADHLLARRTPSPTGHLAWATMGGKYVSGFAHGAAGIACALLRLHRLTGDAALHAAALEAIAFEQALGRNPPPGRLAPQTAQMNAWCNGLAGIGLSRLASRLPVDDAEVRREIEAAIASCALPGIRKADTLCCGNAGRAELLLTAADVLGRPELLAAARGQLAQVAARAARAGGYGLNPALPKALGAPGLFNGTSGIGYMLLRAVSPDRLPALVLWQ